CVCYCSFFFFQAEDGIRDYKVTGVQTCVFRSLILVPLSTIRSQACRPHPPAAPIVPSPGSIRTSILKRTLYRPPGSAAMRSGPRSEERRVGKECGTRWGRGQGGETTEARARCA